MIFIIFIALIYFAVFLRSFLCPQHPYVLKVCFDVPGSGKTTFAAYLTKWALHENAKRGEKRLDVFIVTLTAVPNGQVMNVQTVLFAGSFRRGYLLQSTLQKIANVCKTG